MAPPPVRHAAVPVLESPPEAPMVYVRRGSTLPPLTQPYDDPFQVLSQTPKIFKIGIGTREEVIRVDRLKPHRGASTPERLRGRPVRTVSAALTYPEGATGGGPFG